MIEGNDPRLVLLVCCSGLCAVALGLALASLLLLRGRGGAALPLLQLLFSRDDARDDAIDVSSPRPVARPNLRAIAREQDFDAALRAQGAASSPAPPPGFEPTTNPLPPRSQPTDAEARHRDEDEEFGFSESED
jgi:hypothetical protein